MRLSNVRKDYGVGIAVDDRLGGKGEICRDKFSKGIPTFILGNAMRYQQEEEHGYG
jgi:hypothetical protein